MSLSEHRPELPDYLPDHLGGVPEPGPPDEVRIRLTPLGFGRASQMLHRTGARFVTLLRAGGPEPALIGAFAIRGDLVVLRAQSRSRGPRRTRRWDHGGRPRDGPSRSWPIATACGRSGWSSSPL